MKYSLILVLSAMVGLAQIAHAEDQNAPNKKKKKKEEPQTVQSTGKKTAKAPVPRQSTVKAQKAPSAPSQNQANLKVQTSKQKSTAVVNQRNTNRNVRTQSNVGGQTITRQHRANAVVTNNWRGERFSGQRYSAFRNYRRQFHDRNWWHSHHSRIVFYFGAPYYWDTGYWYPAWGYYPGYTYAYDGPIYGYNGLAPDQVLITVQTRLQAEGYYQGAVDGTMGPLTRQALADYQADHALAVTAAIDEPTLATMGLT